LQKYGKIDVLINNAISQKATPGTSIQSDDDWAESLKGTLLSVHTCIRDIIPIFKNQGQGKVINVSSMYGMIAPDFNVYKDLEQFTNVPQYGAAKAAVIQITKYFASLLGKDNITVNCVSPGPFPSNTVQENKEFIKRLSEKTLLKRVGKPEDLQGIFELLCSDKSNFITGQNIAVDGGWTTV
jgi:gluconate 5-dehydrogenase